jgi:hypothetical protein
MKTPPAIQRAAAKKKQNAVKVVLTIGASAYAGASSGQYGHAEMDALRKFIMDHDSVSAAAVALNAAGTKTVSCPGTDVCGSCNAVLSALGFSAEVGTTLSDEPSGGVSWGANMKVEELMKHMGLKGTYDKAIKDGAH